MNENIELKLSKDTLFTVYREPSECEQIDENIKVTQQTYSIRKGLTLDYMIDKVKEFSNNGDEVYFLEMYGGHGLKVDDAKKYFDKLDFIYHKLSEEIKLLNEFEQKAIRSNLYDLSDKIASQCPIGVAFYESVDNPNYRSLTVRQSNNDDKNAINFYLTADAGMNLEKEQQISLIAHVDNECSLKEFETFYTYIKKIYLKLLKD